MPLAVTHVLTSIISVDLYRHYIAKHKKYFTLFTILVAGIAGLLPDIDLPLSWLLANFGYSGSLLAHRGLTHTPFFAFLFLIPGLVLWYKKKHRLAVLFFVTSLGIFLHLFLDSFIAAERGTMLLWPLNMKNFSSNLLTNIFGEGRIIFYASLDAFLLLGWLTHEVMKHKIKDFF